MGLGQVAHHGGEFRPAAIRFACGERPAGFVRIPVVEVDAHDAVRAGRIVRETAEARLARQRQDLLPAGDERFLRPRDLLRQILKRP